MKHPECYDKEMYDHFIGRQHNPFQFSLVRHTETVDESKALNGTPAHDHHGGSGMAKPGGSAITSAMSLRMQKQHRRSGFHGGEHARRRIVDPSISEVRIFDKMYQKKAEVVYIDAYSGHADMVDLDQFTMDIKGLQKVLLVHGEMHQMEPFAKRIQRAKGIAVLMPEREQIAEL